MTRKTRIAEAVLPDGLVAELLAAMPPLRANSPGTRRRAAIKSVVLARVEKVSAEDAAIEAASQRIVRADEGSWITFAPNVAMRVLHDDGDTRTWLARFQPGGCVPAHLQSGDEEAYIIEGWCYVDRQVMRKGDYQLIRKGARHGEIVSPEGCLVFVRSHSEKRSAAELAIVR